MGDATAATDRRATDPAAKGPLERFLSAFTDVRSGEGVTALLLTLNILGLLVQLFLASRIIRWFGLRVAILVLSVIALGGYTLPAVYPLLAVVRVVKIAENATDSSLNNTARNMLFLPTTRAEKYKAKQAADPIFWRLGDLLSSGLVFAGTNWLGFTTRNFALANLGLAAAWLRIAVGIGRRCTRLTARQS